MHRFLKSTVFTALVVGLLAGCNSTSQVSQWSAPPAERKPLVKVLVCTPLVKDAASRKMIEDQMVASFPPTVTAVPSYTLFPDQKVIRMANKEKIAAQLQQEGFDAALVAAVDSATKREVYVPPQAYPMGGVGYGFYGYRRFDYDGYGYYPGMNETPGYTYEESKYLIETVLFSIPSGKMVWTMTTESLNPDSRQQVVTELNAIINGNLKEAGFIK